MSKQMTEIECLSRMIAPGTPRPGKWRQGVIQILVTSSCDLGCFNCTQASNLRRPKWFMSPEHFDQACKSLVGYFGVIGVFGGNPALSPHFPAYCEILRSHFPKVQCGLWCNHPRGHGKVMRETFNHAHSNLNTHLSQEAYKEFKRDWPESMPFGHDKDSRHSPAGLVSMKDLGVPEEKRWELISRCDINQHWSAGISVFRDELKAWFCEIAMAQAVFMQDDPYYPDTGLVIPCPICGSYGNPNRPNDDYRCGECQDTPWWQYPMTTFRDQVRHHCHNCAVPLRGKGELACSSSPEIGEEVSPMYADKFQPKSKDRPVSIVSSLEDFRSQESRRVIDYLGQ